MKFSELVEKWKRYRKGKDPSWRSNQNRLIAKHIHPVIGHIRISKITDLHIEDVLQGVRGSGLSSQTERHVYNILNQIFRSAVYKFKLIKQSPVIKELHMSKVTNKVPKYLDPVSAWMLLDHVNHDLKYGPLIWLQVLAGLRVGEAIGLRWSDVNLNDRTFRIRNVWNKNSKIFKDHTKNGTSDVIIPIIPPLAAYLKRLTDKSGYVAKSNGGKHVSYEGFKTYMRRIGKRLGLDITSSHGLRHTSTEVWMACGASREHIRELLNHMTIRSTERYIHRPSNQLGDIAQKIKRPKKAA